MRRFVPLLLALSGCAAYAEGTPDPAPQYECTSFPVRSTTAMGAFQAPADVSDVKVNSTLLPAGWSPVGGTVGSGGAYVLACHPKAK
jgi:hypothetical protein